jgi:hypothetical protein
VRGTVWCLIPLLRLVGSGFVFHECWCADAYVQEFHGRYPEYHFYHIYPGVFAHACTAANFLSRLSMIMT